eukprot:TRINITY_DN12732_c0_g1_i1.p1 TRINITY_DN12732_c0_g1~~TRINITY_DN12732_c0_g1_i1.p1  ORF type:complete len:825 (+),score=126.80 TRINITY_DN12732_c0_g1_i1:71-2545(+)
MGSSLVRKKSTVSSMESIHGLDGFVDKLHKAGAMKKLDLSGESMMEIPDGVFSAIFLRSLILDRNKISNLPQNFSKLIHLEELSATQNMLISLPKWFQKLSKLRLLNLSDNKLGSISDTLARITNLQHLDLHANLLSDLSYEISKLQALTYLNVSNNSLRHLPSLSGMDNLMELHLAGNRLASLPGSLGALTSLVILDLSSNQIPQISEDLGELKRLMTLKCNKNKLYSLPKSISSLMFLYEIDLSGNEFKEIPSSLCGVPNLKRLFFDCNKVEAIPQSISRLSNLVKFSIEDNPLVETPSEFFQMKSLEVLQIGSVMIEELPLMTEPNIMTEFRMNSGSLNHLPNNMGDFLSKIKVLELKGNRLSTLPDSISMMLSLEKLNLCGNCVSILPCGIINLKDLIQLNISDNKLSSIPDDIGSLHKLKQFLLGYNQITAIPESLRNATKLRELCLSGNPIQELPNWISCMVNMKLLWVAQAGLANSEVIQSISCLSTLEDLDISRNKLSELNPSLLYMPELKNLNVSGNQFTTMQNPGKNAKLLLFDCSQNTSSRETSGSADLVTRSPCPQEAWIQSKINRAGPNTIVSETGCAAAVGRRNYMEDALLMYEAASDYMLFGVFDGHDGGATSKYLQHNFAKVFDTNFSLKGKKDSIRKTYQTLHDLICHCEFPVSGSTSSTIYIDKKVIISANAGDSRAILIRSGKAIRLSHDHKPTVPEEEERIRSLGGYVSDTGRINGLLAVSRGFGDCNLEPYVTSEPYIKEVKRDVSDEWLVLASDGLWDVLTDQKVADLIRREKSAWMAASKLKDMALLYGSPDNISVIVIRL